MIALFDASAAVMNCTRQIGRQVACLRQMHQWGLGSAGHGREGDEQRQ